VAGQDPAKSKRASSGDADDSAGATAANAADTTVQDGRAARAERRRAERRSAITGAAKRIFRAKGYHQTSVHDIIDEARIARGTFYLYFSSKQELFGELVDEFVLVLRAQVKKIELGGGALEPRAQLRANFRRVVNAVLAHDDVASVILRDPTGFDEESRAQVQRFFDQVQQMLEAAMRVGQELGLVRECDHAIVSAIALGGVREVLVRMLTVHDAPAPGNTQRAFRDPDPIADALLDLFAKGVFV